MKIKAYHKDFDYTYTLGVFETIELLHNKPNLVYEYILRVIHIKTRELRLLVKYVEKIKLI